MRIRAYIIKFVINPIFFLLWHGVYTLVVLFLSIARIGLAIKELSVVSVEPKPSSTLTVSHNLIETPVR